MRLDFEKPPISIEYLTTTPIRYIDANGGGSGFFFNQNGHTYLVTNKHVLCPELENKPTEIGIRLRDRSNFRNSNSHTISLYENGERKWFQFDTGPNGEEIDIAVLPIHPKLSTIDDLEDKSHQSGSIAFTPECIVHKNYLISNDVHIVGYPGDLVDKSTWYPIRRNAVIASAYGTLFNGSPYFLTDARMHPGTSGSPIVMSGLDPVTGGDGVPANRQKSVLLLGIHSATFYGSGLDEFQSKGDSSDCEESNPPTKYELNIGWYPELICRLIN
ncbi:S1 family peptidase [Natronorubrum aibiense]|uniref:Serine protease n=1 Tax=Natronorubrum aibiense TaxID=348826 RepID=A0A5P9P827_9EURY|nr:serine protease [Natronorubrum aibiense]QFU84294.1 hypothetical protein GCU68_17120 [Natronorubrum aibiense]